MGNNRLLNKKFFIYTAAILSGIILMFSIGFFVLSENNTSNKKREEADNSQIKNDINISSVHNESDTPTTTEMHTETDSHTQETTSANSEQTTSSEKDSTAEISTSTEIITTTEITTTAEITTTQQEIETEKQTIPPASSYESPEQKVERILSGLTLEEKVYQMFIITPEYLTGVNNVTQAGTSTKNAIWQYPVGGLIYFKNNIVSENQITSMLSNTQNYSQERLGLKMFLCVDEEGGRVARIGNNSSFNVERFPDMAYIPDEAGAYHVGQTIGAYLSKYGFNVDFAPDADVITEPRNTVIGTRSFGTNPSVVSRMAMSVARGLNSRGIMSAYKHFPGHGATIGDTHDGFAYTEKTEDELMQSELIPFRDAAQNGSADMIMIAHISVPNITGDNTPSSLSYRIVTGILKEKLGYKGLIVTDAMNMGAISSNYSSGDSAILAVKAGNDLLLMPKNFREASQAVIQAVRNGDISEERINESVRKIIRAKLEL